MNTKFTLRGGLKPMKNAQGSVNLRSPHAFVINPGMKMNLDVGVSFDHPVHVFTPWFRKKDGLNLVDGVWAMHDAEVPITLQLRNDGTEPVRIDEGDVVARCVVVDNSDLKLLEG